MDRGRTALLAALVTVLLVPALAQSQTLVMPFTYTWTAPTTGSPVHHYEVQESSDNGTTWTLIGSPTTNTISVSFSVLVTHLVRVRGVDAAGRTGVYSSVSDPNYPDPGVPGAPGKPVRTP